MTQITMGRLVFSSLSRCSPSSQGMSLCRSSLDGSFGVYLRDMFASVLIFRRCFFLKDLRRRSRPPTATLRDFGLDFHHVPLLCDNTSAISVAKNLVLHSRTKHIEVRFHFLRDHYDKGDIDLRHIDTTR
jgi:hypothetical protein